jgi:hypothetical protein
MPPATSSINERVEKQKKSRNIIRSDSLAFCSGPERFACCRKKLNKELSRAATHFPIHSLGAVE